MLQGTKPPPKKKKTMTTRKASIITSTKIVTEVAGPELEDIEGKEEITIKHEGSINLRQADVTKIMPYLLFFEKWGRLPREGEDLKAQPPVVATRKKHQPKKKVKTAPSRMDGVK